MTGDLISALFLFIGNVGHMGVLSYKVLKFTELEDDYLNPTDFAKTMNSLVPYELIVQGVLVFVVLLNWIFSFSSLKLFVLIIMGTHLASRAFVLPTRKSWTRPESGTARTRMKCNDKSSSALFLPAWPFSASCIIWWRP
jgi:hypothetical protein